MVSPGCHLYYRINTQRGYLHRYPVKDITMKTLAAIIIFLVSQAIAMATYPAPPSPGPRKDNVSPYREEAQHMMEAFERALQERREDFKERLLRGDTRLIDVENLSGYAHLNRDELLQQTHAELNKGPTYNNPEMLRRGENSEMPRRSENSEMPRRGENSEMPRRGENSEMPRRGENSEMPRRGENSEMPRSGMNVVHPKTFKVGPLRRTPDQHSQGQRSSKKQALATQDFSHYDSHQISPLFRDHHNSYHDKHTDSQFRVQSVPTRGKHHPKQTATSDFVPEYQQQSGEVRNQRHRHPYRESIIDNSRDSRGHDITGPFDSHDSRYGSDFPFYKEDHSSRRPRVFSSEDNDESKPNYRPHYVNEELDSRERLEVDFIGSHDTDRKMPTGKSFRLKSGEDKVRSARHEERKHPDHHRRLKYKPSISQEADRRKRQPYDLQPSKPKFPPVPKVPTPAPAVTNSGKAVFRSFPPRLEEHINDYNPKQHTLPVRSVLQGVTGFYNGTQRECYVCSGFPAHVVLTEGNKPVGWDRCRYAFHHSDAAIFGIRPTSCVDNCYIRVDPDNSVHRGCYRGEVGVNPETLGCHKQGPQQAVYCFCRGGKCNNSNAPAFF